jgi:hypothetical protein
MKTLAALALAFAMIFIGTGCGQPKAVSSLTSVEEQNVLQARLTKLEETLKDKSPFIAAKLAPGATDENLAVLRSELNGAEIPILEIWYRWHNGCTEHTIDVLPLGHMLSIAESLEDRKRTQDIPYVDDKRKSPLKILDDGAGDGFFLDVASPQPRVFYHMLEDPFPRDYGTLPQFVDFISTVHVAGVASEGKNGMVNFELDRYQQLESEYLKHVAEE